MTVRRPRLSLTRLEARDVPATITVDTLIDETSNAATTSLREAITQANTQAGPDDIEFTAGLTGTIQLTAALPDLAGDVGIAGPGAAALTVRRDAAANPAAYRIFSVADAAGTVTISGLTVADGASGVGGGIRVAGGTVTISDCVMTGNTSSGNAGAIYNQGTLTLADCTIIGNTAAYSGGGVQSHGTLTMTDCTVAGNTAAYNGGGVRNFGTATMAGSTFSSNTAGGSGGGVQNLGTATMVGGAVVGNSAGGTDGNGGGVSNGGTLTVTDCTVSGNSVLRFGTNSSGNGGGVYNGGTLTVTGGTFTGNTAGRYGGGLHHGGPSTASATVVNTTVTGNTAVFAGGGIALERGNATLRNNTVARNAVTDPGASGAGVFIYNTTAALYNTIVARNTGAPDLVGPAAAGSANNLIGNGAGPSGIANGSAGNQVGTAAAPVDPKLGSLRDNGGPTQTLALLPGSPAIDAGANAEVPVTPPAGTDQRGSGFPRILHGVTDIGACEFSPQALALAVPASATIDELQPYTFAAVGAGAPDAPLTYGLLDAPAGAAINPTTGVFTWAPTEAQGPAVYVPTVTVSDGVQTTARPVILVVREVNVAPVFGAIPGAAVVRGESAAVPAAATDADIVNGAGNALTYFLTGGPAGATIDPETGAFAWTLGADAAAGDYAFPVLVRDYGSPSLSARAVVRVTVKDVDVRNGDLVVGGTADNDTVTVNPSTVAGKLDVTLNTNLLGQFNLADITGKIVVRGLAGNDRITVGAAVTKSAVLDGGAGNDTLTGGKGNDTYVFADGWGVDKVADATAGGAADRLDFSAVTAGVAVTKGTTVTAVSGANKVTAAGIESVVGGAGPDALTVPAGNNLFSLTGAGSGTVGTLAFTGIESLAGGSGADTLKFGPAGSLAGTFNGGGGKNTLDYADFGARVTANLKLGTATGLGGVSRVSSVIGSAFDDILVGDDAANVLTGGLGRDVLIGGKGADTLTGGADDDLLIAGFTAFDADLTALAGIRVAWTTADTYANRVAALTAGAGGAPTLDATTVTNDAGTKDSLTGGAGDDWFLTSAGDLLTDLQVTETKTVI